MKSVRLFCACVVFVFSAVATTPLYAQLVEPPVRSGESFTYPAAHGITNFLGGGIILSNFGFGIRGHYAHVVGPLTQITFTAGITGIRYASQQAVFNFNIFYGTQKWIVNKYNRVLGFPFLFGIKRRIFPRMISDNFRFFLSVSGGPALALVFPYLNDQDGNGYRSLIPVRNKKGQIVFYKFSEFKVGFFRALGDATSQWGAAGSIKIGIDFGKNFKLHPTLTLGYFFYYYGQGLKIMYPYQPKVKPNGQFNLKKRKPFFSPKSFFGTPEITFSFSTGW